MAQDTGSSGEEQEEEVRPNWLRIVLLACWGAVLAGLFAMAWARRPQPSIYELELVAEGFQSPVHLTHAGDGSGRIYVCEQKGSIRLLENGTAGKRLLDIRDKVASGGEMGLLSVAFHPRYRENGRFFINYTAYEGETLFTFVSELHADPAAGEASPASEKVLLKIEQPYQNHNGGQVVFGPDGTLYIGMGDGGAGGDPHGHGQNKATLLGAVLRIDVDRGATEARPYGIPADNPLVGDDSARPELWCWGMRNPWRITFDRETGQCWTGDVGQNAYEEIDILEKGGNYGWRIMEGAHCFDPPKGCDTAGLTMPVKDYPRSEGVCVTGGFVYRGPRLPELRGSYVYGDFGSGRIWELRLENGKVVTDRLISDSRKPISSFGEDEAGELYVVTYEGSIWRLKPAG